MKRLSSAHRRRIPTTQPVCSAAARVPHSRLLSFEYEHPFGGGALVKASIWLCIELRYPMFARPQIPRTSRAIGEIFFAVFFFSLFPERGGSTDAHKIHHAFGVGNCNLLAGGHSRSSYNERAIAADEGWLTQAAAAPPRRVFNQEKKHPPRQALFFNNFR